MKSFAKKILSFVVIAIMVVCCVTAYCIAGDDAEAATDSLAVKVGFYGGPYYEIQNYSYTDMCRMSDGTIWTYSGLDSGSFMRICYAWGVQLADLVNDADVDIDSVNYFHMGTADSYGERYATFSAATLFGDRYFYPNMVTLADISGGDQQQLDFSKVDSSVTAGAEAVPTLLAIGSSDFSREEAVNVARNGAYTDVSAGDLSEKNKYRLIFGQAGLNNMNAAQNVRNSDKCINEINLQLAGAPEIKVTKKLKKGEANKVGSKYDVKVRVELPVDYSYISDDVLKELENQVLKKISANYDSSVIKLSKTGNGSYTMDIVGAGDTDLTFSYSRQEYDGSTTSAKGSTTVSGEEKSKTDPDKQKPSITSPDKGTKTGIKGTGGKKSVSKVSKKTGIKKVGKNSKKSDSAGGTWQSTDLDQESTIQTDQSKDDGMGSLAGGTIALFLTGAAGTVIRFFRNI